jgi:hypothetical protein
MALGAFSKGATTPVLSNKRLISQMQGFSFYSEFRDPLESGWRSARELAWRRSAPTL